MRIFFVTVCRFFGSLLVTLSTKVGLFSGITSGCVDPTGLDDPARKPTVIWLVPADWESFDEAFFSEESGEESGAQTGK